MFNSYDFEEQSEWVKQDCNCESCEKKIEELTERCLVAEGEIVSIDENGKHGVSYEKLSIIALAAVDKLHQENLELKERLKKIEEKLGL